jgi:predicted amidohydrolase
VLPELASSGYIFADRDELSSLAETREGPAITEWANLAGALGLSIVGDSPRLRVTPSTTARPWWTRAV